MASPEQKDKPEPTQGQTSRPADAQKPHRPTEALLSAQSTASAPFPADGQQPQTSKRRRNHRAGKKKRNRRQSFMGDPDQDRDNGRLNPNTAESSTSAARPPFYRLGQSGQGNFSETSLDSEELLDHR